MTNHEDIRNHLLNTHLHGTLLTESVGQAVNSALESNLKYADVKTCSLNQTSLVLETHQGGSRFVNIRVLT